MPEGSSGRELPHNPSLDVEGTIAWLTENEFSLVETRGPEGMGCQSLVYQHADGVRVRLRTDRSQWMADVALPAWDGWYDLDVIVHAISGDTRWETWSGPQLPEQLPPGVEWRRAIPDALRWAATTPDAASQLQGLQHERADQLFGPLPSE